MTVEEQLEGIILSRFKTIRDFSRSTGVAYTTLKSILEKRGSGLSKASVQTVIRIFDFLDLDIESVSAGQLKSLPDREDEIVSDEKRLLTLFRTLDSRGQAALLDCADNMVASGKYISEEPDTTAVHPVPLG